MHACWSLIQCHWAGSSDISMHVIHIQCLILNLKIRAAHTRHYVPFKLHKFKTQFQRNGIANLVNTWIEIYQGHLWWKNNSIWRTCWWLPFWQEVVPMYTDSAAIFVLQHITSSTTAEWFHLKIHQNIKLYAHKKRLLKWPLFTSVRNIPTKTEEGSAT